MDQENNTELYSYTNEEKPYVLISMLGSFIGFLPSFIIYVWKRDSLSNGARNFIKGVLNFELVILCIASALFVLNIIPILGTLFCAVLTPILFLFNTFVIILATLSAVDKKEFKYPFPYKFIA